METKETATKILMSLLLKKKSLHMNLLNLLNRENEILKHSDLDALWQMNDEKNRLTADIENLRLEIIAYLDRNLIKHDLSVKMFSLDTLILIFKDYENGHDLADICMDIKAIKIKIHTTQAVNMQFVEDYLKVLEDLVSVITETGQHKTYGRNNMYPVRSGGMIVRREA